MHDDDDFDGKPYGMSKPVPTCPKCEAEWDIDVLACPACGFKPEPDAKAIEPIKRGWDASPTLQTRMRAFIAYVIALVLLGALSLVEGASLTNLVPAAVILSLVAAFAVGTFDRVELRRNYFGRVALSRKWRVCFIPCSTSKISLRGIETVATSANAERTAFDWIILVWMLSLCVLPGVLWWIYVFSQPTYQVALAKSHGIPAVILYQGPNSEQTNAIAKMVSEVCHYRWRRTY